MLKQPADCSIHLHANIRKVEPSLMRRLKGAKVNVVSHRPECYCSDLTDTTSAPDIKRMLKPSECSWCDFFSFRKKSVVGKSIASLCCSLASLLYYETGQTVESCCEYLKKAKKKTQTSLLNFVVTLKRVNQHNQRVIKHISPFTYRMSMKRGFNKQIDCMKVVCSC